MSRAFRPTCPSELSKRLIQADLVVADLTERNPNVYYELGISHSVGNKTIVISQDVENLPFDVKGDFTYLYEDTESGRRLLYYELKRLAEHLLSAPDTPSNVVQTAGRDYFDLQGRIRETLDALVEEREGIDAFREYLSSAELTDNSQVLASVASEVAPLMRTSPGTFVVAISGAAGLGKTTATRLLAEEIAKAHDGMPVACIPLDAFMLDRAGRLSKNLSGYEPLAHDIGAVSKAVGFLLSGKSAQYRAYDHVSGTHSSEPTVVNPAEMLVLDGVHSFHPALLPRVGYKLFLYATPSVCKELRFLTDVTERRYTVGDAFRHAEEEYRAFEQHALHYGKFADQVVVVDRYWKYTLPR